ncbi:hypothetical protein EDEG_00358 [Edhazardia aedis USNM 41457]|uniref:Uncharacterized protein n=1 Tax=Edhazardia aedis (strain USNM 41457) TaxID=1003232 RepID=J9DK74_EDHAE|nr:hypothetical protein EDEG_00358 [Edhazardia aedis USNM 41457]|eukprot:EJW01767.1 hypothetical protein EDEG_00358 [Edhazardia aedis USNM 41457]
MMNKNNISLSLNCNRNTFNKNILEYYFRYNKIACEYNKLNSIVQKSYSQNEENMNINGKENDERIEIMIKGPEPELCYKKGIDYIKNLNKINLRLWLENFENICNLNEWNDEQKFYFLNRLIIDKNVPSSVISKIYAETRKKLIEIRYNKEEMNKVFKKMEAVRLKDFIKIEDYVHKERCLVDEYALGYQISKNEHSHKHAEVFFRGLSTHTRIELAKVQKAIIEAEIEYLTKIEEEILSQMEERTNAYKNRSSYQQNKERENYNSYNNKNKFGSKWCTIHRSTTHYTKECFLNPANKKNRQIISLEFKITTKKIKNT